jgi:hypothetical protein
MQYIQCMQCNMFILINCYTKNGVAYSIVLFLTIKGLKGHKRFS